MGQTNFEFSDTVAGYVTDFNFDSNVFGLQTSDGRDFKIRLSSSTYAELVHNLGDSYVDCTGQMRDMLARGRFIYAYGVFYPDDDGALEAEHLIFVGKGENEFVFEQQDWWIKQIQQLANFYLKAQFGDDEIDWSNYCTMLDLYGHKMGSTRQETDTISRLIYGFASAYLLTGDERCLEAAEKGSDYLREHFRAVDASENICYWYHAVEFSQNKKAGRKILGSNMPEIAGMRGGQMKTVRERKLFMSEFGDDYDAIPAYEQIYALAGPTQTYRITGDVRIRKDIDMTLNLFDRHYRDHEKGGYYSHIDPITFSGRSESLGRNRARKNWNSVGDHAPAYLINLLLATGEKAHLDMLVDTADTITQRFQDYDHSAFVQEKFHEDWSFDQQWGWQQNRGVVGHNLKIAWNLTRIYHVNPDQRYVDFAKKIAELMPKHGGDPQRGGWYDVVDRELKEGQTTHRFAFHDRKAWWQQEQGILAYMIMAGSLKAPEYLKYARESAAFYNAFFLDHEAGGVYFNVFNNGMPYLLGTERDKGSHSMSGYHSFELCYLASVYTNLMIAKQPMDFHFKPKPGGFKDNILRVSPDILPKGSIKIESVTVNGEDYTDFDAEGLTVKIPSSQEAVKIKVRIVPTQGLDHFNSTVAFKDKTATVTLTGELDARALSFFRANLDKVIAANPEKLVIDVKGLQSMTSSAARALIFAKQKLAIDDDVVIVGANDAIKTLLNQDEFSESVEFTGK
ncbi:MAG: N-acyl-D-glucosamine 2-epimerase [Gallionellales bacterium RIFCSPLOWO2_12_FULL_59_22]|nr:MAG: N-acyl-D-glucosamine 2-epimerase [Gallionellales bacterium RIFCSPLOWO2_02_58_13]OGT13212.1 MAG: N-acyl-D-glucosamine 2-epimerase [Gallionellales bacterium RIFCSPLOWO2_12_FULL_59_22]